MYEDFWCATSLASLLFLIRFKISLWSYFPDHSSPELFLEAQESKKEDKKR